MFKTLEGICFNVVFTACVRSTRGRFCFHRFLSVHRGGGGGQGTPWFLVPGSFLGVGVPLVPDPLLLGTQVRPDVGGTLVRPGAGGTQVRPIAEGTPVRLVARRYGQTPVKTVAGGTPVRPVAM